MASEKPDELVRLALLRGRFCEQLAPVVGMGGRAPDYFLMGMFSLIDAILDFPLAGILEQIPLADDVKAALLGEPGPLHDALDAVRAYTAGQWKRVAECAGRLGIDEAVMPGLCTSSLLWCSSSDLAEPDRKAA
jgi:EAL and modified HD-GYP domain-containing signal transduction protein